MKFYAPVFLAVLAITVETRAETQNCEAGHLMDAAAVTEGRRLQPVTGKVYTIKLQRGDVIYTVETSAPPAFDPKLLTNRERLTLCVVDKAMVIKRPDGSELKTKIVREDRETNY